MDCSRRNSNGIDDSRPRDVNERVKKAMILYCLNTMRKRTLDEQLRDFSGIMDAPMTLYVDRERAELFVARCELGPLSASARGTDESTCVRECKLEMLHVIRVLCNYANDRTRKFHREDCERKLAASPSSLSRIGGRRSGVSNATTADCDAIEPTTRADGHEHHRGSDEKTSGAEMGPRKEVTLPATGGEAAFRDDDVREAISDDPRNDVVATSAAAEDKEQGPTSGRELLSSPPDAELPPAAVDEDRGNDDNSTSSSSTDESDDDTTSEISWNDALQSYEDYIDGYEEECELQFDVNKYPEEYKSICDRFERDATQDPSIYVTLRDGQQQSPSKDVRGARSCAAVVSGPLKFVFIPYIYPEPLRRLSRKDPNVERILRRTNRVLNKLAPDTISTFADVFVDILLEAKTAVGDCISLVVKAIVKRAVDEPEYCEMYARFCFAVCKSARANLTPIIGKALPRVFRRELMKRCVNELRDAGVLHWRSRRGYKGRYDLDALMDDYELHVSPECADDRPFGPDERVRVFGTIGFMGELFRNNMYCIMNMLCTIETLLYLSCEKSLECLTVLLTVIGPKMIKVRNNDIVHTPRQVFLQLEEFLVPGNTYEPIPKRTVCKIKNVIDLRKSILSVRRRDKNTSDTTSTSSSC